MSRRAKKKHIPEHNHTERWLVSYSDYMTLMFALFVVLYAAASVNEDKYQVVIENFYSATKEFSKQVQVSDTEGILTNEADEIIEEQGAGLLEDRVGLVDRGFRPGIAVLPCRRRPRTDATLGPQNRRAGARSDLAGGRHATRRALAVGIARWESVGGDKRRAASRSL